MTFELLDFVNTLREEMYKDFPYDPTDDEHIRDKAFFNNPVEKVTADTFVFNIGNEESERKMPYYHILEDAQVISKRGRATKTTRGSQDSIADLGKRDYGKITITRSKKTGNSSSFQEYRKNVRGSRSKVLKSQRFAEWGDGTGQRILINKESKYYYNIHYHYIERMLENRILDFLATKYDLKRKRTTIDLDYDIKKQIEQDNNELRQLYANVDLKLPF